MVASRKRPDVAFEVAQKLDRDRIRCLRDEISLRHFQFVALEGPRFRQQLIAGARGQHQEIRGLPLAFDAIARLGGGGVHGDYMRALNRAACFRGAIQQHAVQDRAGIDHDRMSHVECGALVIAADQLDGVHQFLRIGIVEQEREALDGLVGEAAAAGLLPCQVLVKNIYRVARARKLFTAHRAGWSAADDRNICHVRVSLTASNSVAGMRNPLAGRP